MINRVAIYLRVSTIDQSTELQHREIIAFVQSRGWEVAAVFEDKLSGTQRNRPALNELMTLVRSRKVDTVICWKLDRLFRSLRDLVAMLQELGELNVSFVALRDQIDLTTSSGRLMAHLLGAFAEFEASLIRERVRAGLDNARSKGVRLGRPPSINVERVVELRALGYSLSAIAEALGTSKSGVSKTLSKLPPEVLENMALPFSDNGVD